MNKKLAVSFLTVLICLSFSNAFSQALPDSTADLVIGQTDFTTVTSGLSPIKLNMPRGIALDTLAIPNVLWICDFTNNRILGYDYPLKATNDSADYVIGQADFVTGTSATTNTGFSGPAGIALDASGNLWVADRDNERVLVFQTPLSTDFTADFVFGQGGSFVTGTANNGGISDSSLYQPTAIAFDDSDRVYIADQSNHRILIYDDPLNTDRKADYVIGQPDFATGTSSLTDSTFNVPYTLAVSSTRDIYVADYNNHRILKFDEPLVNDKKADQVFGQGGSYTANTQNNPALNSESLANPIYVYLDANDNLYIADYTNNRILVHTTPDTTADYVFGQSGSFTSSSSGATALGLNTPTNIIDDRDGNLIIADFMNNRVLVYQQPYLSLIDTVGYFGATLVDSTLNVAMVTIKNYGGTNANITNGTPTGPFSLVSPSFPYTLEPDSSQTFLVSFTPTAAGTFNSTITFTTNDPANPTLVFDVHGTGKEPHAGNLAFIEFHKDDSLGVNGISGAFGMDISPDGKNVYVTGFTEDAIATFTRNINTGELTFYDAITNTDISKQSMDGAVDVAVSPDGKHTYVAGLNGDAITIFSRNITTGALTYSDTLGGSILSSMSQLAFSPDGAHLYATARDSACVVVYERDPSDGSLEYIEHNRDGKDDGYGNTIDGLNYAVGLTVTRDGKNVYATGGTGDAIAVFSRQPVTGKLRYMEVHMDVAAGGSSEGLDGAYSVSVSPDGRHVYVAANQDNAIVLFDRSTSDGSLSNSSAYTDGVAGISGLAGTEYIIVSQDNNKVYSSGKTDSKLLAMDRNISNGALSSLGYMKDDSAGVYGLNSPYDLVLSPDGKHLYVAGRLDNAISVFSVGQDTSFAYLSLVDTVGYFGAVLVDSTIDVAMVTIRNTGSDTANVTSGTPTGPFSLVSPSFPYTIYPDSSQTFLVSFTPTAAGTFNNTITFATDDSAHLSLVFDVVGIGTNPHPGELEFIEYFKDDSAGFNGLNQAYGIDVSPDGKNVYAVGFGENAIASFSRNITTGELTFIDAITSATIGGQSLVGPLDVEISPDGRHAYVAGYSGNAMAIFSRDQVTGALTFVDSLGSSGVGSSLLDKVSIIDFSPDGAHLYAVGRDSSSIVVFERDPSNGMLKYIEHNKDGQDDGFGNTIDGLGAIGNATSVAVSPDGKNVYATGATEDGLAVFKRLADGRLRYMEVHKDVSSGGSAEGLDGVYGVTVSADGNSVYAAASTDNTVVAFTRNTTTGALTYVDDYKEGAGVSGLSNAQYVTVSPEGDYVYASGATSNALVVFSRSDSLGVLTYIEHMKDDSAGVNGLLNAREIDLSPDGRHLYVAGRDDNMLAGFELKILPHLILVDSVAWITGTLVDSTKDVALVSIKNTGADTASVISGTPTGAFSLVGTTFPYLIDPDSAQTFIVRFAPTDTGSFSGTITFATTDPNNPSLIFTVNGIGTLPNAGGLSYIEHVKDDSAGVTLLQNVEVVTVSPDGKHLYAGANDAINIFSIDQGTGVLTLLDEITIADIGGTGMDDVTGIVISPGGEHLYTSSMYDHSLTAFSRDPATGLLTFISTLSNTDIGGVGLYWGVSLGMSPDGAYIYGIDRNTAALSLFSRDPVTGVPAFIEVVTGAALGGSGADQQPQDIAISPDGKNMYVACASSEDAVLVFNRDLSSGQLTYMEYHTDGSGGITGLQDVYGVTVSHDGRHVYATSYFDNAVVIFERNTSDGTLTFVDEVFDTDAGVDGLAAAIEITMSPDDRYLYITSEVDDGVAVFQRDISTGNLTFVEVENKGGYDLDGSESVAITPDGRFVYVATSMTYIIGCFEVNELPSISITPVTLDFDSVFTGMTDTMIVYVSNDSGGPLDIDSVLAPVEFTIEPADTAGISAGDTVHFKIIFAPSADSTYSDSIYFYNNDPANSIYAVGVQGVGVVPLANLTLVDSVAWFSGTLVDSTKDIALISIKNTGGDTASVLSGTPTGVFSLVSPTFPQTLEGDSAATFLVRFTPTDTGSFSGTVTFTTNDPNNPSLIFTVNGIGTLPNAGGLSYIEHVKKDSAGVTNIGYVQAMAISPDGKHLYAGGNDDAVVIFGIDPTTRVLTFLDDITNVDLGAGLVNIEDVIVSPDGKHVYTVANTSDALTVFSRDPATGLLTFVTTITNTDIGGVGLDVPTGIAISPDGAHLYSTDMVTDAIALFSRDPDTGIPTFVEAVSGAALGAKLQPRAITLSPDGKNVYVICSATQNALIVLNRDPVSGKLTHVEDFQDGVGVDGLYDTKGVAVSHDSRHLYVTGYLDDALSIFDRSIADGTLTYVRTIWDTDSGIDGLNHPRGISLSPDDRYLYVASDFDEGVAVFQRDVATGDLTFVEVENKDGYSLGGCYDVAVSPDGRNLYAPGAYDEVIAFFDINALPAISITPVTLDFDSVFTGMTDTMIVYVSNDSGGPLDIDSVLAPVEFTIEPADTAGISAGDTVEFKVIFAPSADSAYADSIYFISNDPVNNIIAVSVQGVGTMLNQSIAVQTGNWSAPATWQGGAVPSPGDDIIISDSVTVTFDAGALDTLYSDLIFEKVANPTKLLISSNGSGGSGVKFENVKLDTLHAVLEVTSGTSVKFDSLIVPYMTQFILQGDGTVNHGSIVVFGNLDFQGGSSVSLDSLNLFSGSKLSMYDIDHTVHRINVDGDVTFYYSGSGQITLNLDSLSLVNDTLRITNLDTDSATIQSSTPVNLGAQSMIVLEDSSLFISSINLNADSKIELNSQTLYVDTLDLNTNVLTVDGPGRIDNTTYINVGGSGSALTLNSVIELNSILFEAASSSMNVYGNAITDNLIINGSTIINISALQFLQADTLFLNGNSLTVNFPGTLKTAVPIYLDSTSTLTLSETNVEEIYFADTTATLGLNDTSTVKFLHVGGGGQLDLSGYTLKSDSIDIYGSKLKLTTGGRINSKTPVRVDSMGVLQLNATGKIRAVVFTDTTGVMNVAAVDTVYKIFSGEGGTIKLNSNQLRFDTLIVKDSRLRIEGTAGGSAWSFGNPVLIDSLGILDLSNDISIAGFHFMGKDAKLKVDSLTLSDMRILKDSYIEIGTGLKINNAWFSNSGAMQPTTVTFQGTGGFDFGTNFIQLAQDMTFVPNAVTLNVSSLDSIIAISSAKFDPGTNLDLSNLTSIGGQDTSQTLTLKGNSQRVYIFGGNTHLSGDLTLAGRDSMHLTVDSALVIDEIAGKPYVMRFNDTSSVIADSILGLIVGNGIMQLNTEGIVQLFPTISLDTIAIAFDTTFTSATDTIKVWVKNDGTAALDIDSVGGPAEFSTIPADTSGVAAGDSFKISILFSPAADSVYSDTLRFYANDPNKPYANLAVSGIGYIPSPELTLIDTVGWFGGVLVDSTRDIAMVTIRNFGNDTASVSGVTPTGPFSVITPGFPQFLDPDSSVTFLVRYNPTFLGNHTGTLTFNTTDAGNPTLVFDVFGRGTKPFGGNLWYQEYVKDDSAGVTGLAYAQDIQSSPDGKHVYVIGKNDNAIAAFSRDTTTGSLTFVEMEQQGSGGVTNMTQPTASVVSPDGKHVYVTGYNDDAVVVFGRNSTTGELNYISNITNTAIGGTGLNAASYICISPDGAHVYATGNLDNAVVVFERDPGSGLLGYVEYEQQGVGGVDGLSGAQRVFITSDGKHVYVNGNTSNAIAAFSRNKTTGELKYIGVKGNADVGGSGLTNTRGFTISPDGGHLYVGGNDDHAVVVFSRDTSTGVLTYVEKQTNAALGGSIVERPMTMRVSPDGKSVYVTGSNPVSGLNVFDRDIGNGQLTYREFHKEDSLGIQGMNGGYGLSVTPDGRHVYVGGPDDGTVAIFKVDTLHSMIILEPWTHDFGSVDVLTEDSTEIWVKNGGTSPLRVDSMSSTMDFWITPDSLYNIPPGDSALAMVHFMPMGVGPKDDTLRFYNDDPGMSEALLAVQGFGYQALGQIIFIPDTVEFDTVFTIADSVISIWIRNDGDAALFIDSMTVAGDSIFYVMPSDTITIAVNDSAQFSVYFSPDTGSAYVDSLLFFSNDSLNYPAKLMVKGIGEIAYPKIVLDTITHNFDTVNVNTSSDTLDIWIYNFGDDSLNVTSVTLPANFSVTPDSIIGIQPGDSANFQLWYTPPAPGILSDSLIFHNNDPGMPEAVYFVQAIAYQPHGMIYLNPISLNFDSVDENTTDTLFIWVKNIGDDTLNVDSVGTPAFISLSPPDTAGIQVGDSVKFEFYFTPPDTGDYADDLIFYSSDPGLPADTADFQGIGRGKPVITLDPATHNFTTTSVYYVDSLELLIINDGKNTLVVGSVTPPAENFIVTPTAIPSILPGDTFAVTIEFIPVDSAAFADSVVFTTNDTGNTTISIDLTGEGISPVVIANPDTLFFDSTMVFEVDTATFWLRNDGQGILAIMDSAKSHPDIKIEPADTAGILPGDSVMFTAYFAPTLTQSYLDSIIFPTNEGDSAWTAVYFKGVGTTPPGPEIFLNRTSLNFDTVETGQSKTLYIQSRNVGAGSLTLSNIDLPSEITVDTSSYSLDPGDSLSVAVTITPVDSGFYADSIIFNSNDTTSPSVSVDIIAYSFMKPIIAPVPAFVFDTTEVGTSSFKDFIIRNSGSGILSILGYTSTESFVTIASTSGSSSIGPDDSLIVTVEFSPTAAGNHTGSIIIQSNDEATPYLGVSYNGFAVVGPQPEIIITQVVASTVAFDTVTLGSNLTKSFYIRNDGDANLDITGITPPAGFEVTPSSHSGLVPGDSVSINVKFKPTTMGAYSGTLSIASNDPGNPTKEISLSGFGKGPIIIVSPVNIVFDTVNATYSDSLPVYVKNDGNASLNVTSVTVPSDFEITPASSSGISPGDSVEFTVIFSPSSAGIYGDSLKFHSNDLLMPSASIWVAGTAEQPTAEITVIPLELEFDTLIVNTADSQIVVLKNSGLGAYNLASVSIPAPFEVSPSSAVSVDGSDSLVVIVVFRPVTPGSYLEELIFNTNDPNAENATINVRGTAIPVPKPKIIFDPPQLDFGNVSVGDSLQLYIEVGNDGNLPLTIYSISSSQEFITTGITDSLQIDPGLSSSFEVLFKPQYAAFRIDTIFFANNDSDDPNGGLVVKGIGVLVDDKAPVFKELPVIVSRDTGSVKIKFKLDEPASSEFAYAIADSFHNLSSRHSDFTAEFMIDHTYEPAGLIPNTLYNFQITLYDSLGNGPTVSQVYQFQTLAAPDFKAPVIDNGPFYHVLDTSTARINWSTDEAANSILRISEGDSLSAVYTQLSDTTTFVSWHEMHVHNLMPNTKYTFIVMSSDEKGNGPVTSWPITFRTLARPDFDPPEFELNPQVLSVDTSNVFIKFNTNEIANTFLYYNIDTLYDRNIRLLYEDSLLTEIHNVTLFNLLSGTRYKFHVETFDSKGNGPARSSIYEFKTLTKPDIFPPKFIGFASTIEKDTGYVKLRWFTDEISTSIVEYGIAGKFDSTKVRFESSKLVQEHIVTLTGLQTFTKYEYRIRSADENGYEALHPNVFTFKTAENVDVKPPEFRRQPYPFARDTNKVTINWEINELGTGILEIAVDTLFDDSLHERTVETDLTKKTSHSITIYGLEPFTRYKYRAGAIDGKNNGPVYSDVYEFTTLEKPDNLPPVIDGYPDDVPFDTTTVKITYYTNEPANSRVVYHPKLDSLDVTTVDDQTHVIYHEVLLGGLTPGTKYMYAVYSWDEKGNGPAFKGYYEFETPAAPDLIPPSFKEFQNIISQDTSSFTIGWETFEEATSWMEFTAVQDTASRDTILVDDQGLKTQHELTADGLPSDTEYSVRVYSYDSNGNGPTYSQWFTVRTAAVPDLAPPVVQGFISIIDIDTASANVRVTTNEESYIELEYGLSALWPAGKTPVIPTFSKLEHNVTLSDLMPDTSYTVRMRFTDRSNNISQYTAEQYFSTISNPDSIPPGLVGHVNVTNIDTGQATVEWNTDEDATSIVEIVPTSDLIDTTGNQPVNSLNKSSIRWLPITSVIRKIIKEQKLKGFHSQIVKELRPNTEYTLRVGHMDKRGNGPAYSGELRFKTLPAHDLTPPVIKGIPSERDIDTTSVKLIWGTNEPANSMAVIRAKNDSTAVYNYNDGGLVTEHSIYVDGLSSGTEYEYRVSSVDAHKNGPTLSIWQTFNTLAVPDLTPPDVYFGPLESDITHNSAIIMLKTDGNSFVLVSYGTNTTLGLIKYGEDGLTTHNISLTNLSDSTLYYYQVEGKDSKGNEFVYPPVGQERLSFSTLPKPTEIDTSRPEITYGPNTIDVNYDQFTVKWGTDVLSNSLVEYWLDTSLVQLITQNNTIPVKEHEVNLTGLVEDTTYYYRFRSRGANNNEMISDEFFVNTLAGPDTVEPEITGGPFLSFLGITKATIEWRTDKNTSTIIEYGLDSINIPYKEKADEIVGVDYHQIKLSNLAPDSTYYYKVSSYSPNGKSVTSEVMTFTTLAVPDTIRPKILEGPSVTQIGQTSFTIEWKTDELSNSIVYFLKWYEGLKTPVQEFKHKKWVDKDAAGVFHHKAVITGLSPKSLYIFRVRSDDISPKRNIAFSKSRGIRTLPDPDTRPPVLTGGPKIAGGYSYAYVNWNTDELSDSYVTIRATSRFQTRAKLKILWWTIWYKKYKYLTKWYHRSDPRKTREHSVRISPIAGKLVEYELQIFSRDAAGNLMGWPVQPVANSIKKTLTLRKESQVPGGAGVFFTTEEPDVQKPVIIEGPTVVAKTASSITVQWKTDERADSYVEYGTDENYGTTKGDIEYEEEHKITLTNLSPATKYNFLVKSTDASGNGPAQSQNSAVSTEAEADETPPKITEGPVAESITNDQATIIWETDEYADTYVSFGTTEDLGDERTYTEDEKVHQVVLTNLEPSTTYYYKVQSTDIEDNGPTTSSILSFTTTAAPDVTPPVISNITVSAVTDKTVTITYTTDELGDSFVHYGYNAPQDSLVVGSSDDVTDHSVTITNLDANTGYLYSVGSTDKSDNETIYEDISLTFTTAAAPDTVAPDGPANLTGVEGNKQLLIWWDSNSEGDLAGYNIYRKRGSGAGDFQLIETLVADTFYFDGNVDNDVIYWYKITAADKVVPYNESDPSNLISLNPSSPLAVPVPSPFFPNPDQRIRYDEINLVVDNITLPPERTTATYEFVVAEESDFFSQVASITGVAEGDPQTIWSAGVTLNHDQTYYWKARAFDGYFYSKWTSAQSFIADSTMATSVELVDFTGEDIEGRIRLSWETAREVNNAGFRVYRSFTEDGEYELITGGLIDSRGEGEYELTDLEVDIGRTYHYILESVNTHGFTEQYESIAVTVHAPEKFELHQNYPNPFNPVTTIKFEIPRPGRVVIRVYNVLGQEVKTIVNKDYMPGFHRVRWNGVNNFGRRVSTGMYIYRIIYGNNVISKKMVIIK
ncbi:beta-propeller fold lactonase family protein [candidate division KSB1 bacterium]